MPSKVSIDGADHDREPTVEELKRELAVAREQQAATAGILAAISNAPTDSYRVFAAIAESAARLCSAHDAVMVQRVGDRVQLLARHGPLPTIGPVGQTALTLTRGSLIARSIIDNEIIHVNELRLGVIFCVADRS
jgi:hypothetical protein